jgi:hypothetical protein
MAIRKKTFILGDPSMGGFKGGIRYNISNNDIAANESPNMYNYIVDESGLVSCGGCTKDNAAEIIANTGITGLFRFHDGTNNRTFAKCGTRVFEAQATGYSHFLMPFTEAGDASNQCSAWSLTGADLNNTNGGALYWKLVDAAGTRTVSLYKNSDGAAGNLVAQGSRSGDGAITLTEQNSSGLAGSVTVTYSGDDTTLAANTLTFGALSASDEVMFSSWFSGYYFTDGNNLYRGTAGLPEIITFTDQDGGAIAGYKPKGKSVILHKQRLWLTRDAAYPTRVYWTESDYYDRVLVDGSGDIAGYVECDKDDGKPITGMISTNDRLIVFKRDKMFFIDGDYDEDNLSVVPYAQVGAYDQKTIVDCDGVIVFWGPHGMYLYTSGMDKPMNVSDGKINYELAHITPTNVNKPCAAYNGKYYVFSYPYDTSTYNNRTLIYDTKNNAWMPRRNWNASCFAIWEDGTLHAGWGDKGYVKELFDTNSDDGAEIAAYWSSRFFNSRDLMGIPGATLCLEKITLGIRAGVSATVSWQSDTFSRLSGSHTFTAESQGDKLADAEDLGTHSTGYFMLSGRNDTPRTGSLMTNRDETNQNAQAFTYTLPGGANFREIQFTISQSDTVINKIDYLEVTVYLVRS